MRELNIDEVKTIQLKILENVHSWCMDHHVNYWLDCGTLLGAIRHKGYIPWDDDIDIGMMRDDYDCFCKEFSSERGKYQVVCIENDKSFYQPHAKVIDTDTVMIDGGHQTGINIDIFVYDNAPDDEALVDKMFDRRDLYRMLYELKQNSGILSNDTFFRKMKKGITHTLLCVVPSSLIIKAMVRNCKKYSKKQTKRVGNFSSYSRMVCKKRVFDSFIETSFEGKQYRIPYGYDEWLRSFYGNYMELPPEEKRVSHHSFKAYVM